MNCPYCQSATRTEWTYCKGCHWTIPEPEPRAPSATFTNRTALSVGARGFAIGSTKTTRPGVPAKDFEASLREIERRVEAAKSEMGRVFLPVFERVLDIVQPTPTSSTGIPR